MSRQEIHAPDGTPLRLGRYRLVRVISTGGMARVFEARREAIEGVQPRVALKVILPEHAQDEGYRQLFINEARVGSLLRHQNLIQVQDFDADQGLFYLVMEFVEGVTLRQAIRHARRQSVMLPLSLIAEVGRQVCDGLHHAHSVRTLEGRHLQLVHRDLKPSNLMLNPQGVVKLLDFGISKAQIAQERAGVVRGTWGYMAPEQAGGDEIGPAADLFGLAAVLYEMAALEPLFAEKEPEEVKRLLAADEAARRASRLSGQHGPLVGILVRALQRDPQARYPSAAAMGRALSTLAGDPFLAREQIVRFQDFVVAANRSAAAVEKRGSAPTLDGQDASPPADGLPLRVGDVHRPAARARARAVPPRGGALQQLQGILAALFIGVAAGIVGFTAWKILAQRQLIPSLPLPSLIAPLPSPPPAEVPPPEPIPEPPPELEAGEGIVIIHPPGEAPPPEAPEIPTEEAPEPEPEPPLPQAPPEEEVVSPEPAAPPQEPAEEGLLTVGASTRARVLVDGRYVGNAPVFRHPVGAGGHAVTLQAETGEQITFQVQVDAEEEVQRVWSFETNEWLKKEGG